MFREILLLSLLMGCAFDAQAIHHPMGQEEDDEELIREPVRYKLKFTEWESPCSQGPLRATFNVLQNGSFLERVTLPARASQHIRFEAHLSAELNRNPLIPLPRTLGQVLERVRYTFSYKGRDKTFERVITTPRPLQAKWTDREDRDLHENHYTLALSTSGDDGVPVLVHQERPFEGNPERHVLLNKEPEVLECYLFSENGVVSASVLRTLWQNPQTRERYASEERFQEKGIPSHLGREIVYVKPFVLGGEILGSRSPYQGRYTYQRDLKEEEHLEGRETNRLLYSDGRSLYLPYVTQELWQGEAALTRFFIASYRKQDQLFSYPSVVARNPLLRERGLPEGLYHLVALRDGDRRVEQWVRLGEDPCRVEIDISSEPSSIPGRHVVMPLGLGAPHEEAIHRVLGKSHYAGPERVWSALSSEIPAQDISALLNHYISENMRTEGVRKIVGYCTHKLEAYDADIHLLRDIFLRLGRRLKDLGRVSQRDSLRVIEGLQDLIDLTILKRGLELLQYLEHQKVEVEYRVTEWLSPLVKLSSQILALGAAPHIERGASDVQVSALLLSASDIQAVLDASPGLSVCAYAWNRVFLDRDIGAPGRSFCIVAPAFKVVGARTINLRGSSGTGGGRSWASKDGSPGAPGQNGGNFYARTAHPYGAGTLHVDVSGGDGGRGGDGRDGFDGADGQEGNLGVITRPPVPWMGERELGTNRDYWSQQAGHYEYHEALGTDGTPGGAGGRAGVGGIGGFHGSIFVEGMPCSATTQKGKAGADGSSGAGGLGGLHGRHCQGVFLVRWHHTEGRLCGKRVKHPTAYGRANGTDTIVPPQHLPSRGRAPSGCRGIGVNSVGRRDPAPPVPLEDEVLLQQYTRAYQEAARNTLISLFVGAFPGLELE